MIHVGLPTPRSMKSPCSGSSSLLPLKLSHFTFCTHVLCSSRVRPGRAWRAWRLETLDAGNIQEPLLWPLILYFAAVMILVAGMIVTSYVYLWRAGALDGGNTRCPKAAQPVGGQGRSEVLKLFRSEPMMGNNQQDSFRRNILLAKLEDLLAWDRKNSLWPFNFCFCVVTWKWLRA